MQQNQADYVYLKRVYLSVTHCCVEIRASCLRSWITRSHTVDQVQAYRLLQQKRRSWLGASSKEERGSLLPDSGSVFIVDRYVYRLAGCTWAFPATRPTTWPVGQGPSQPGLHTGLSSIIYHNPVELITLICSVSLFITAADLHIMNQPGYLLRHPLLPPHDICSLPTLYLPLPVSCLSGAHLFWVWFYVFGPNPTWEKGSVISGVFCLFLFPFPLSSILSHPLCVSIHP